MNPENANHSITDNGKEFQKFIHDVVVAVDKDFDKDGKPIKFDQTDWWYPVDSDF